MTLFTSSPTDRVYRARRIGTTFGRVYLGIRANRFIARRLRPPDMASRWSRFNRESATSIYETAIELHGLILKGCQFLGSRSDVLPREYVQVLSRLQDRVPPRPFSTVRRAVEQELGRPLSEPFASFSRRPIASASLAQVHEARLHDGRRVAVKVQYPEIAGLVRGDLANLRVLFRAVGVLEREVDLMPLVEELAAHVPRELDFVNEGRNAETVAAQLARREDVGVPAIHWELTTPRVLVMDFVEGIKISDAARLRRAGVDPARVARTLAESYCEQVFVHGFFHADPHPGNLLVQPLEGGDARVVFVDFGLSKQLPPDFRQRVIRFAASLLSRDARQIADGLIELGFETRGGSPEALEEIAQLVLDAGARFRGTAGVDRATANRIGREISERIREDPIVRLPTHIVLLSRVLALLSGVNRSLGARVDLMNTILPYVTGMRSTPS